MPAPAVITGAVTDATILSDQKIRDVSSKIASLDPDVTPLATFLMKMKKRICTNAKVEWLDTQPMLRLTTVTTDPTTAGTSLVVASTAMIKAGHVLRMAISGENMLVSSVTNATTLVVVRNIGGVTGILAAAVGSDVVVLNVAAAQGATIGTLLQTQTVGGFNYHQIARDGYGQTNTMGATDTYGENQIQLAADQKMLEHKRGINLTAFFGRRDLRTASNITTGFAGGLTDYAVSQDSVSGGTLTRRIWEDFLRVTYRYGGNKYVFCSPLVQQAISSFATNQLQPGTNNPTEISSWGVQLVKYLGGGTGPGGFANLVFMKDWQDFQTATSQFGGWAIAVDMDNVQYTHMRGRDTRTLPNRQGTSEDSDIREILTEFSFEIRLPDTHRILKGTTTYT